MSSKTETIILVLILLGAVALNSYVIWFVFTSCTPYQPMWG